VLTRSLPPVLVAATCAALLATAAAARPTPLAVRGFNAAMHVAARGTDARPVAVALHGNFDRAEWSCEAWAELVDSRAWLLCARGRPRDDVPRAYDRWTYGARGRVRAEIEAGLAALRAAYPERIAAGPVVLIGFSLGAIIAARLAIEEPSRFPRLLLVEGAHAVFTAETVRRFARRGGRGVVFGCGSRGCGVAARRVCALLLRERLECAEVTAAGLGHSYTDPIPSRARPPFDRLVSSDVRWRAR
jgi:pimeloyl-ACP methyl ester carboxylesterase